MTPHFRHRSILLGTLITGALALSACVTTISAEKARQNIALSLTQVATELAEARQQLTDAERLAKGLKPTQDLASPLTEMRMAMGLLADSERKLRQGAGDFSAQSQGRSEISSRQENFPLMSSTLDQFAANLKGFNAARAQFQNAADRAFMELKRTGKFERLEVAQVNRELSDRLQTWQSTYKEFQSLLPTWLKRQNDLYSLPHPPPEESTRALQTHTQNAASDLESLRREIELAQVLSAQAQSALPVRRSLTSLDPEWRRFSELRLELEKSAANIQRRQEGLRRHQKLFEELISQLEKVAQKR